MIERQERGAICWDLDDTLGVFEQLEYQLQGKEVPNGQEGIFLRADIRELLKYLSSKGYRHFLTTSAGERYAEEALRISGLNKLIAEDDIWPNDIIYFRHRFGYKTYAEVEESAFFYDKTKKKHSDLMLVVGDRVNDQPEDLKRLVFIEDINCRTHSAEVLRVIIDGLLKQGKGSFIRGFDRIYGLADNETSRMPNRSPYPRKIDVKKYRNKGVEFLMEYSSIEFYINEPKSFPRIYGIKGES